MPNTTMTDGTTNPSKKTIVEGTRRVFTADDFELIASPKEDAALAAAASGHKDGNTNTTNPLHTFISGVDERLDAKDDRRLQFTLRWEGGGFAGREDAGAALSCVIAAVPKGATAGSTNGGLVILDCIDWATNAAVPYYAVDGSGQRVLQEQRMVVKHASADEEGESQKGSPMSDSSSPTHNHNSSPARVGVPTNKTGKVADFVLDGYSAPTFVTNPAEGGIMGALEAARAKLAAACPHHRRRHASSNPNPHPDHERITISSMADLTEAIAAIRFGWNPKAFMAAVDHVVGEHMASGTDGCSDNEADTPATTTTTNDGADDESDDDDTNDGDSDAAMTLEETPSFIHPGKVDVIKALQAERRWWPDALEMLANSTIVVTIVATAKTVSPTNVAARTSDNGVARRISVAVETVGACGAGTNRTVTDLIAPVYFPSTVANGTVAMFALVNAPTTTTTDTNGAAVEWILKPIGAMLEESNQPSTPNTTVGTLHKSGSNSNEALVSEGRMTGISRSPHASTQRYAASPFSSPALYCYRHSFHLRKTTGGGGNANKKDGGNSDNDDEEQYTVRTANFGLGVLEEALPLLLLHNACGAAHTLYGDELRRQNADPKLRGAYIRRLSVAERSYDLGINRRPPADRDACEARRKDERISRAKQEERRTPVEWLLMVLLPLVASMVLYLYAQ